MANPVEAIDSARPRAATYQRAIEATAVWLSIPCPKNRSLKIATGSSQTAAAAP